MESSKQWAVGIGATLARLRKDRKLLQRNIAAKLYGYGFTVSVKTIYNWEKGISQPSIAQFLALCDILGIDDVLWQFAGKQRGPYMGLNRSGRRVAHELIDLVFQNERFRDDPADQPAEAVRMLRLYDIPVSAGAGNFLDESGYDMIKAPDHVPAAADFALRISGDSMEPLFQDGQIIWIKPCDALDSGDIGVFVYSGEVYFKRLIIGVSGALLRSLNPKYADIPIVDGLDFRTVGKSV